MSKQPRSVGPGRPVRGSTTGRPIMALLDLAGRRWTLRILWELTEAGHPLTFRELRERCAQMSSSVLTRRLAELREVQLVTHTDTGYMLTPLGTDLVDRLEPLSEWSRTWAQHLDRSNQEPDA